MKSATKRSPTLTETANSGQYAGLAYQSRGPTEILLWHMFYSMKYIIVYICIITMYCFAASIKNTNHECLGFFQAMQFAPPLALCFWLSWHWEGCLFAAAELAVEIVEVWCRITGIDTEMKMVLVLTIYNEVYHTLNQSDNFAVQHYLLLRINCNGRIS